MRVWNDIVTIHSNAYLVLVGPGDYGPHNCEAELKEFVRTQSLDNSVQFTGKVDNVQCYLQASDIFVLPSETEGFPNALLEAMACGLAVIVRPIGGSKDIVENGKNGFHIMNSQELYSALDALLKDKILADTLGRAARKTIIERFDINRMVKEYMDLFSSLNRSIRTQKDGLSNMVITHQK